MLFLKGVKKIMVYALVFITQKIMKGRICIALAQITQLKITANADYILRNKLW